MDDCHLPVPWPLSAPRINGRARATMWPRTLGRGLLRAYRSSWRPRGMPPCLGVRLGGVWKNAKRFRAPLLHCTDDDSGRMGGA